MSRLNQLVEFLDCQKTDVGTRLAPLRSIGNVGPRIPRSGVGCTDGDAALGGFAERAHPNPKNSTKDISVQYEGFRASSPARWYRVVAGAPQAQSSWAQGATC